MARLCFWKLKGTDPESKNPVAVASSAPLAEDAAMWSKLPVDLQCHIIAFLPANEIACTGRLINKATSAAFSGHVTAVRLSQPVPHHAYSKRWGAAGAMRGLTLRQRRRLLCLTAASGVIPNLELATEVAECTLTEEILEAAAAAGQMEVCQWILQHRYRAFYDRPEEALEAAAKSGNQALCEWLLSNGWAWHVDAACAAARNGHLELMEWLLRRRPTSHTRSLSETALLKAVAQGCDLPTLQRVIREWHLKPASGSGLAAAAGSCTADWQAKVAWLEDLRVDTATAAAATAAVAAPTIDCGPALETPDAVDRLEWLLQRGYTFSYGRVEDVIAQTGNTAALELLLSKGYSPTATTGYAAAEEGQLGVLQVLHSHQKITETAAIWVAAHEGGHLPIVQWMAATPGLQRPPNPVAFYLAAVSGNMELLMWLLDTGCRFDPCGFVFAARAGNVEMLEWIAAKSHFLVQCFAQSTYEVSACKGDLATMRCLRRLGVKWSAGTFTRAVWGGSSLAVLRWMVEAGCPVDWRAAIKEAEKRRWHGGGEEALAWLRERQARGNGVLGRLWGRLHAKMGSSRGS